jgi:cyanophycinase
MGSGEFTPAADQLDRWLLDRTPNPGGPVLIVPTASAPEGDETFNRWMQLGVDHYTRLGQHPEPVPLRTRDDASNPEFIAKLQSASLLFFSGGNPGYLVKTLEGTPFWNQLAGCMEEGLPVGGCSAGAVALGCLAPDTSQVSLSDEGVPQGDWDPSKIWIPGLNFLPQLFIGAHWDALDTFIPGLTELIRSACPPNKTLVGIAENTGIAGNGASWEVVGSLWVEISGRSTTLNPGDHFELNAFGP